jgi:hypothetical protein
MKKRVGLLLSGIAILATCIIMTIAQRPSGKEWVRRAAQPAEGNFALLISFGHKDQEPHTFDGQLKVSTGRLLQIRGWRFQQQDKILSENAWQFSTRAGPFNVLTEPLPEPGAPPQRRLIPNGVVVTLDAPSSAKVDVSTQAGSFSFTLSQVQFDKPLTVLEGNAWVERLVPAAKLSDDTSQDDYPSAIVAKDGSLWVAWLAYRNGADQVMVARRAASGWSEAVPVTEQPGDHFKTALAQDGRGRIWVAWSSQVNGNWDLYARSFDGAKWSATQRLTTDAGPDLFHRLIADPQGNLYLVWQGFRGGQSDIFLKTFSGDKWSAETRVSTSPANDWEPTIASDAQGTVYIAWDSYDRGNYDIFLRRYSKGKLGPVIAVATSPRFEAHADVACDRQGRAWIGWEESGLNWGKDEGNLIFSPGTTLYHSRRLRVACLEGDRLRETKDDIMDAVPEPWRRYAQVTQLVPDAGGRIWALFRLRTYTQNTRTDIWANLGRWELYATYHDGQRWQPAMPLENSVGRLDVLVALALDPAQQKLWCVWPSDERPFGGGGPGRPYGVPYVGKHHLYYASISLAGASAAALPLTEYRAPVDPPKPSGHPNEAADVTRVRAFTYKLNQHTYRIFRGDLHRHTDISPDGAGDGSLIDLYRYALDAAKLDFILVGDHNSGNDDEYSWWRTQKSNDLFYLPGHFVPLYGYERSVNYPNGHRNVAFAKRGVRTLPISAEENQGKVNSGPIVYPYLRKNGGVGTSHSLATSQGTDWRDNDPELEPIAELYQGYHASYEYEGAPRAESADKLRVIHGKYQPEGFIWNAWAKGLKLGVQSSSDHISTHVSYACVLAEDFTREGLIDAMKKRHSYAATDNVIIDFRARDAAGEHLMGDIYERRGAPTLLVKILGTANIQQVDVIKNNKFIYTASPKKRDVDFKYVDNDLGDGTSYYYVRVQQADGQMVWSSPIWVTRAK